ncbi:MAG: hypothetical protein PHS48_02530 [Bacteroidales bacterium]|nr:hypothetical protein [Bacteroidales bacterium]
MFWIINIFASKEKRYVKLKIMMMNNEWILPLWLAGLPVALFSSAGLHVLLKAGFCADSYNQTVLQGAQWVFMIIYNK